MNTNKDDMADTSALITSAPILSKVGPEDQCLGGDVYTAEDERIDVHRMLIWQRQEEFLRTHFGDRVERINFGWGSSGDSEYMAESTRVYCDGKVHILSSRLRFADSAVVEHDFMEDR